MTDNSNDDEFEDAIPDPDEPDQPQAGVPGPLGDGRLKPGKYNMSMARKAFEQRYPISPKLRAEIVAQMWNVLARSESTRDRIAAAKVLLAADRTNIAREALEQPNGHQPHVNVNVAVALPLDARRSRLSELAERLGIDGPADPTAEIDGDGDPAAS